MPDGMHGPCTAGLRGRDAPRISSTGAAGSSGTAPPDTMTGTGGAPPQTPRSTAAFPIPSVPQTVGEPIAVAFDGSGQVVVQSREPAMLALPGTNNTIPLSPSAARTPAT